MTNAVRWTPDTITLSQLQPWAGNPRMSSKAQARRLLRSWKDFGQVHAIAVGPDNTVYDGHQRLSALLTVHGPDYEVDVRRASRELSDVERRALVVALHAGAVGSWDWAELANWDADLLTDWGMDDEFLEQLNRDTAALIDLVENQNAEEVPEDPGAQINRAEFLKEKWNTQQGQLWGIGKFTKCPKCKAIHNLK